MNLFTKILIILSIFAICSCARKSPIVAPDDFHKIDFDKTEE